MGKILDVEQIKNIPPLYATEKIKDPIVHLRLYSPIITWQWFITEYNPTDKIAFGLVSGLEVELGYISIDELESANFHIQVDTTFKPTPLSIIKKSLQ